jgi:tRNA modification GTPase
VGKSSLFNALSESEAIVSAIPGTTRDYLTRQIELGGINAELIDTAGWQGAEDTIEEQAQRLGYEQAMQADVLIWCVETGAQFDPRDELRLASTGARVIRVRTKSDLYAQEAGVRKQATGDRRQETTDGLMIPVSVVRSDGTSALRTVLAETVDSLVRSPLAPSQSRCRHHVEVGLEELTVARDHVANDNPLELTAASLRIALDQLGEMTGAVYTNDLLDRIFSRFCIGK